MTKKPTPRFAWILLTQKLSTQVAPPRLSIHFSTSWPIVKPKSANELLKQIKIEQMRDIARSVPFTEDLTDEQLDRMLAREEKSLEDSRALFGLEHDPETARAIRFRGETIRVFDDEFSIVDVSRYYPEIVDLIEETPEGFEDPKKSLTRVQREVYDAALVDGCGPFDALMVATGQEVEGGLFPPIGWFKVKEEYGLAFAEPEELEITDLRDAS